ncbi:MAG TPA: enoyl-CoA hydratase-related protein [Novosphingobium sp.]
MPDFATEFCTVAVDGHVMTVTLDRPERRNALHADANHELGAVFDAFEQNPELWIAVVTGAGDKAFCAGADLVTAPTGDKPPVPESGFAGLVSRFDRRKPVIAAVNGMAMGGGFETALASDIVIAADTASFGLTEPRVGLAALGGGIQRVVEELGPKRAHALLLTGRKISAHDAHAMGIVAEVVPAGELMDAARRWADEIMECSPASIAATKAVVQSLDGHSVEHSMKDMFHLPEVRSLLTGPDAREGPTAFAQKRKPNWANPT